ncbi:velvet factor-domain-containing protein [Cladochytrium replicatum]|nr:velvet factor-domain-containing protein [Cladochytrium replicatum]
MDQHILPHLDKRFVLRVLQTPEQARMCGYTAGTDRRMIDQMPVLELLIEDDDTLQSPDEGDPDVGMLLAFARLMNADRTEIRQSNPPMPNNLIGNCAATPLLIPGRDFLDIELDDAPGGAGQSNGGGGTSAGSASRSSAPPTSQALSSSSSGRGGRAITSSLTSSPDGVRCLFVFPDLSIRSVGVYTIEFSLVSLSRYSPRICITQTLIHQETSHSPALPKHIRTTDTPSPPHDPAIALRTTGPRKPTAKGSPPAPAHSQAAFSRAHSADLFKSTLQPSSLASFEPLRSPAFLKPTACVYQ